MISKLIDAIKKLVQDSKGGLSSARAINLYGALTMSILLLADFYANKKVDGTLFTAFAIYCAGGYGVSKLLDKDTKEKVKEDPYIN